jgi:carboxyl-terminal processing protease
MLRKSKVLIFGFSFLVVLYAASAAFFESTLAQNAYPVFTVFMRVLERVSEDYVEVPDMSKVQQGAMQGLIDALDPRSAFLTKDQFQAVEARGSGKASIGAVLSKRANIIHVVSTLRDGPAAAAGLRAGDYIVRIDGANVEEASLLEAESLLRGEPGTRVTATVFRGARTKPLDIEMVRKIEVAPPVGSRMLDGQIGHLEVSSLAGPSIEQARITLKRLVSSGAQKLILDLRDCADGEAESGAEVANFFLRGGTLGMLRGREGKTVREFAASADKFVTDLPVVVLVNGSTAGPAEIAAGALKDNGRAMLVGVKTYGIGATQNRLDLKSGGVLVLSTAKYYTPNGKLIQNDESPRDTGIKPDVECPDQDRMQDMLVDAYFDSQEDGVKYRQLQGKLDKEQLEKAVEILKSGKAPAKKAA